MNNSATYQCCFVLLDNGILCVWVAFVEYVGLISPIPFVYRKAACDSRGKLIDEAENSDVLLVDVSRSKRNSLALTHTYANSEVGEWVREPVFDIVAKSIVRLQKAKLFTEKGM